MPRRETIQLYEHEGLSYDELSAASIESLEQIVEQRGAPLFSFYRHHLRTRQYVGLVQTSTEAIQVLPKIYERNLEDLGFLLLLLRLTGKLQIHPAGRADLAELNGSFLEVWIRHFAESLHKLLQERFRRQYVEVERRTSYIRGKLRMEAMHTGREELTGRFPCRYEVFTPNHLLNQILKFCNGLLLEETRNPRTKSLLRSNRAFLGDVEDRIVTVNDVDRIHLNRLNRAYEPLLDFCRLLLSRSTLDVRSGRVSQLSFFFDMNQLFERSVATLVERFKGQLQVGGSGLKSVKTQASLGALFGEFGMSVDLVLEDEEGRCILMDTKYKSLDDEAAHGGLSQSDFYQMHAYAKAGRRKYNTVILLYPSKRRITRRFDSNHTSLHVRTIDPRSFYDTQTGQLIQGQVIAALNEALDIPYPRHGNG